EPRPAPGSGAAIARLELPPALHVELAAGLERDLPQRSLEPRKPGLAPRPRGLELRVVEIDEVRLPARVEQDVVRREIRVMHAVVVERAHHPADRPPQPVERTTVV